jgi:hypothetical protein
MSSPFADKFLGKSPMSPTSKALVGGQNRLSPELQAAIKASPADMHHGSPAEKHDPKAIAALEAKLARVKKGEEGAEGQGGVDYELQVEVEKQIKEAKGVVNIELDKADKADAEHKDSPLEGAYASGAGGAKYVSILPHIQKLQNDLEGMAAKGGKKNQEKSMEKAIAADDDFMSSGPGKDMSQSGVENRMGLNTPDTKPLNIDTDFDDLIEFDEGQEGLY